MSGNSTLSQCPETRPHSICQTPAVLIMSKIKRWGSQDSCTVTDNFNICSTLTVVHQVWAARLFSNIPHWTPQTFSSFLYVHLAVSVWLINQYKYKGPTYWHCSGAFSHISFSSLADEFALTLIAAKSGEADIATKYSVLYTCKWPSSPYTKLLTAPLIRCLESSGTRWSYDSVQCFSTECIVCVHDG